VERLAADFLKIVCVYREHAAVLQAVTEVAAYDATVREFWRQKLVRFTERTIEVLQAEQDAGRTPGNVDLVNATRVIVMGGERAIFDQVTTADPSTDAAFASELAMVWWYGAYRRPEHYNDGL
jgi:hypothetical protein